MLVDSLCLWLLWISHTRTHTFIRDDVSSDLDLAVGECRLLDVTSGVYLFGQGDPSIAILVVKKSGKSCDLDGIVVCRRMYA